MQHNFLSELCESKLIPSLHDLKKYDTDDLCVLAFINILSLRILLEEDETKHFAEEYVKKTIQWRDFAKWRNNATDLYVVLYSLISDDFNDDRKDSHYRPYIPVDRLLLQRWLRAAADRHLHHDLNQRFFVKLDTMFKIRDSSLKSIRRLVMDWNDISLAQRRLALTRLLQYMRTRAAKSELLQKLNHVAVLHNLEIDHVKNPETGELKENFLLTLESASAGATGAASVAAVVGGLGAGFDADYSKSVYPAPKSASKKQKIIKRV